MIQAGQAIATFAFLLLAILRAGILRYARMSFVPKSLYGIPALLLLLGLNSCLDEPGQGSLNDLSFSRDTVFFDTVFTQIGTSTQVLKLYNKGQGRINIDEIRLNPNSVFRFNADGDSGPIAENLFIDPGDSLYVFLEATLDPNGGNAVLIHEDSLMVLAQGDYKQAILAAPGQDARYYLPTDTLQTAGAGIPYSILDCQTTWDASKPVVIVGYLVVDSLCNLEILAGTKVHFFNNGALWVYRGGSLQVLGELGNPVTFEGTRLNATWRETPGQWDRILINEGSSNNLIRHAIIKNGFIGIQADHLGKVSGSASGPGKVTLESVEIRNMSGLGLYTRGLDIDAYNTLVHNCGQYSGAFTLGGSVRLDHCTFGNHWNRSNRSTPAFFFSNYFLGGNTAFIADLNLRMRNSIIYGSQQGEFEYDSLGGADFNYLFEHCLIKAEDDIATGPNSRFVNILRNEDPLFRNPSAGDYRLDAESPAMDAGSPSVVQENPFLLRFDLKGWNRTYTLPDLGAIEKQ